MKVQLHYSSLDDRGGAFHDFDTAEEAGVWARKMLGDHPELGSYYAVSGDGVGKIMSNTEGLRTRDLFPGTEPMEY
jgi:hypothetical protein